jgi:hypothetical protein
MLERFVEVFADEMKCADADADQSGRFEQLEQSNRDDDERPIGLLFRQRATSGWQYNQTALLRVDDAVRAHDGVN